MSVIAAQQGLATANQVYGSSIVQDALASGSIPHKVIYAVVFGGGMYLVTAFVTSGGITGLFQSGEAALINTSPIGMLGNLIAGATGNHDFNLGNTVAGVRSRGFLLDHASSIAGGVGAILGFYHIEKLAVKRITRYSVIA